jgi:hypothetical protein
MLFVRVLLASSSPTAARIRQLLDHVQLIAMSLDYLSLGSLSKNIGLKVMMMALCPSPSQLLRFLRGSI